MLGVSEAQRAHVECLGWALERAKKTSEGQSVPRLDSALDVCVTDCRRLRYQYESCVFGGYVKLEQILFDPRSEAARGKNWMRRETTPLKAKVGKKGGRTIGVETAESPLGFSLR